MLRDFPKSAINLSINTKVSSLCRQDFQLVEANKRSRDLLRLNLPSLFPDLFFKIFAVENIPFTASGRHVPRKRKDLLADYFVKVIFVLEKVMQDSFGLAKSPSLMGEICKISFPETVDD